MSATSAPLALVAELTHRCPLRYVASVQYYGWGLANRRALLPTREQLDHCAATFKLAEERLKKNSICFRRTGLSRRLSQALCRRLGP